MKVESEKLISDLIEKTRVNINQVEVLSEKPISELNQKTTPETWSILELIFKSGLLGNYFAKSMLPKEQLNKMKTFADKNPNGSSLDINTLTSFITDQHTLLTLLDQSREVNLTKTKTAISISKWIKLRLGDTLRVVIYHNQRHVAQATR